MFGELLPHSPRPPPRADNNFMACEVGRKGGWAFTAKVKLDFIFGSPT